MTNSNRWPIPARLAIGLANAGCDVSALCLTPGHPLQATRTVRNVFSYSGLRPLRSLLRAIDEAKPDFIIPCDDRGVQHLHELHARSFANADTTLTELIERSLGDPKSFAIVTSRYNLLRAAADEGVLVPRTDRVDAIKDVRSFLGREAPPWVLKADGTWGGKGVRFAGNTNEAEQSFLELTSPLGVAKVVTALCLNRDRSWLVPPFHRQRPSIVAQSWINGRPANCAVVCWKGKILAGIAVEVISSNGVKGPAIVVRVVEGKKMMFAAERIASRLGLSGFFGLDFMIEARTGLTYLIEMNPRCTPLCHLQLGASRDMIAMLCTKLTGHANAVVTQTEKEFIAYFPQALSTKSEFLDTSFHDVPQGETELIEELLHPWSERSLLGRAIDRIRKARKNGQAPIPCVFPDALSAPSPAMERQPQA